MWGLWWPDIAGLVRRDSGAAHARVFVVNAGQPSGWPASAIPHGRPRHSPKRRTAKRLTVAADRALPDAGVRPALMLPRASGPATTVSAALRTGAERAVSPCRVRRGGSPSPAPMHVHRVGWLLPST